MCARAHDLRNALIFVYVCGICPCGWTGHPPSLLSHPLSLSLYSISSGEMHLVYEFYAYFHHYEFHTNQPKGKNIFHPVRFVHLNSRIILWPVIIKKGHICMICTLLALFKYTITITCHGVSIFS